MDAQRPPRGTDRVAAEPEGIPRVSSFEDSRCDDSRKVMTGSSRSVKDTECLSPSESPSGTRRKGLLMGSHCQRKDERVLVEQTRKLDRRGCGYSEMDWRLVKKGGRKLFWRGGAPWVGVACCASFDHMGHRVHVLPYGTVCTSAPCTSRRQQWVPPKCWSLARRAAVVDAEQGR